MISPIEHMNMGDLKRQAMMRPMPGSAHRQYTQIKVRYIILIIIIITILFLNKII